MASLFGPTPEEILAAQRQQQEQSIMAQGQEFGIFRPLYQAGLRFGQAGANVVEGLFPEAQDPALRKAQAVQTVLQQYQGQDMRDPSVLSKLSSDLFAVGAPDAGLKALQISKELAPKVSEQKRYVVGGSLVTPEGSVVYQGEPKQDVVKTTPEVARVAAELGYGVRPNIGDYTQTEASEINRVLQQRSVAKASAAVPPQEKAILKNKADLAGKLETDAVTADTQLSNASAIGGVLNRAFTGTGSGAVLKVGQIANALGVTVSGTTETEQLNQLLSKLAQGQAKSLPGALSEKELTFLREAIGTSGVTKETLQAMLGRMESDAFTTIIANKSLQTYQNQGKDLNKFDFSDNMRKARRAAQLLQKASPEERREILGY